MKTRLHILVFLLSAWAVTSCVYAFDPQIDGEGGYMIVSGNLVIGELSQVSLNYSWSLVDTNATDEDRMRALYTSKMHVEDSRGGRYENLAGGGSYWYYGYASYGPYALFDLQQADPSLEYRLVIENDKGTYASTWAAPMPAGAIDSLSYRVNDEGTHLEILVAAHGDGAEKCYYHWSVTETWEYHAGVYSLFRFAQVGTYPDYSYDVVPYENGENLYYCWTKGVRGEIMTASTLDLKEDRLVDHLLYTIGKTDERISVLYRAEVQQTRISEEAYRFWQTMEQNGSDVGGLFSPEPSDLRGNVANVDDPDEIVLGYVDVQTVLRDTLYIDNYVARFYKSARAPLPLPDTLNREADYIEAYFHHNMLPGNDVYDENTGRFIGYEWWPSECIDCRRRGGTKQRPAVWPNSHI